MPGFAKSLGILGASRIWCAFGAAPDFVPFFGKARRFARRVQNRNRSPANSVFELLPIESRLSRDGARAARNNFEDFPCVACSQALISPKLLPMDWGPRVDALGFF